MHDLLCQAEALEACGPRFVWLVCHCPPLAGVGGGALETRHITRVGVSPFFIYFRFLMGGATDYARQG